MLGWIIFITYTAAGVACLPMFIKASFYSQKAKWSHQKDAETMTEASWLGFAKSLVWPVSLAIHWAVNRVTAEQRAIKADKNRKLEVSEARQIIAKYERDEQNKWSSSFQELEGKPKRNKIGQY